MGRIAGVAAAQTRERLLRAAADVFAGSGYDGARVADIAAAAGVSNGALYAHFGSKAELLVAALRTHGQQLLAEAVAAEPGRPVTDLLLIVGRRLPRRREARGYLIVEALAAARRHEDVGRLMRGYLDECIGSVAAVVSAAQGSGELDPALSPDAIARFCLLLSMGSALVTPVLNAAGDDEWATLLAQVVTAIAARPFTHAGAELTGGST